ncbi:piggyBac transposable element-derived protein 3-like [Amyelois transitella]|uniref:piggyBac transposable element-derived protein 3-like n=1 Tax=Amyelois transitella TaxID=680683 RepID=UPI00298FE20A|nr:piggyBac transposable element-derived protein 3-like [Amyelois transitella]
MARDLVLDHMKTRAYNERLPRELRMTITRVLEIVQRIVEESNLYSVQKNVTKPLNLSETELIKFMAILIYMSVIKYPNVRLYWSNTVGFQPIKDIMTVNRFETIRRFLHFNNNEKHLPKEHPQHDRLHKIRPIISHLNEKFALVPMEQKLSIDEQMCATKVAHFMKQYLPNKPHKWGFKLYVMCSVKGYAHKFEIYTGQENERLPDEPDFGPVGNVVVRLARGVPSHINHIIYFDNFYTSVPLVTYLAKQGIYSLGTVQSNRLVNCKLPDKKTMMKKSVPRGTYEEQMTEFDGIDLTAVTWKNNKVVTFLSSYVGAEPVGQVERFDKANKTRIKISCPHIIKEYNAHMGGVDLMDSFFGRYRIAMRSRKWYLRILYHLLDMTVINSWLVYKNLKTTEANSSVLNLCNYRLELAEVLAKVNNSFELCNKRGMPSTSNSVEMEIQAKKRRGPAQHIPPKDIRTDNVGHWPAKQADSFKKYLRPNLQEPQPSGNNTNDDLGEDIKNPTTGSCMTEGPVLFSAKENIPQHSEITKQPQPGKSTNDDMGEDTNNPPIESCPILNFSDPTTCNNCNMGCLY